MVLLSINEEKVFLKGKDITEEPPQRRGKLNEARVSSP
jgi:hypothetical protein